MTTQNKYDKGFLKNPLVSLYQNEKMLLKINSRQNHVLFIDYSPICIYPLLIICSTTISTLVLVLSNF